MEAFSAWSLLSKDYFLNLGLIHEVIHGLMFGPSRLKTTVMQ